MEKHAWPALPLVVHWFGPCDGHVFVPQSVSGLHATSHRHELAQLTVPHAPVPLHVALHLPVPHVRLPHALVPPEHIVVHAPVVQLTLPHALVPVQVALQLPLEQLRSPHALAPPLQSTVHAPVLQLMLRHAPAPAQCTAHGWLLEQVMSRHAPDVLHEISQLHPAGQLTLPPEPVIEHVIVPRLHDVHAAGHPAGASSLIAGSITQ